MQYSLKALRSKNGFTQSKTAKQLGISLYSYRKIERDPANTDFCTLLAIANLLHVKVTDIFLPTNITNCNTNAKTTDIAEATNLRQGKEEKAYE